MMCYVLEAEDVVAALPYAKKLGEAMQLTNFLRDVKEDYEDFGRIYMPEEDLQLYELTHEDIKHFVINFGMQRAMCL